MFVTLGKLKTKPGKETEFIQKVEILAAATRQCPGCLSYELLQSHDDDTVFFFHETWESEALFREHFQIPECSKFEKTVGEMAAAELEPYTCSVAV